MNQWLEKQWADPWKRVGLLGGLFILVTFGIIQMVQSPLEEEETALAFYKALWIEGNREKAGQYVADTEKAVEDRLERALAHSNGTVKPGPVSVVSEGKDKKEFYIHRSDLNHGFNLVLQKENGVWKVTAWEFDLSSRYNSINHYNPELKNQWKEIENP